MAPVQTTPFGPITVTSARATASLGAERLPAMACAGCVAAMNARKSAVVEAAEYRNIKSRGRFRICDFLFSPFL
jgi:hypothetical protein